MEQVRIQQTFIAGAVALAVLGITARAASAQAPTAPVTRSTVQPTITAGLVYDNNVFAQPTAVADQVLRVTPGLSLIRARPKMVLTGVYSFDAERYQRYTDLTTPSARQTGLFTAVFDPTTRRSWTVSGGYYSTTNPAELNTLTSLSVARQRADRFQGGAAFHQDVARQTTLDLTYTATSDHYVSITTIGNLFGTRLGHHPTARSEYYIRGDLRQFDFGAFGGVTVSNSAAGGYMWHSRDVHMTVEGGAARTNGQLQAIGNFGIGRAFGRTDITGTFGRDVTTAVGYVGAITVDHVEFALSRMPRARVPTAEAPGRQPPGIRLTIRGGAARNTFPTGELMTYHAGLELSKAIAPTLVFLTSLDATMQDNTNFLSATTRGNIIRNRALVSLQYSPWSVR